MFYQILADMIVAVHVAYVGFVLIGQLLILLGGALRWKWVRNFWFRSIHLVMILVVVGEALVGITCPLTTWEHQLRVKAGQEVGEGSFIGRLLHDLIFVDLSQQTLTLCYVLFGLLVIGSMLLIRPRWPWASTEMTTTS